MLLKRVKIPNRSIGNYTTIKKDRENIYLSGITSYIWSLLDKGEPYGLVLNRLKRKYSEREGEVENTLINFIGYLQKRKLLQTNNFGNRMNPGNLASSKPRTNSSLGTEITKFYYHNKFIYKSDLELTYRCNLNCKHCYNIDAFCGELSTAQWENVMDQLADMGCINLAFTGGEVLTRRDFLYLLEYACHKEFSIRIKSNGVFISREIAKAFRTCMPYLLDVEISLYGTTPQTHDWFTQSPGSFERSYQGIKNMRREGVSVFGKYLIMKQNLHECVNIPSLSKALDFHCIVSSGALIPRVDGDRSPLNYMLSTKEHKELLRNMVKYAIPFPSKVNCDPAHTRCSISPEGNVCSCEWLADISFGNIKTEPLRTIWLESPEILKFRALVSNHPEECEGCPVSQYCGRCPATAYLETGSLNKKAPISCRVAYMCADVMREQAI